MYNSSPDFLKQLEDSRRSLFGTRDPRNIPLSARYYVPREVKVLSCHEDINGEYVPFHVRLESMDCSNT